MATRVRIAFRSTTALLMMALWVPLSATGQPRENPALMNQRSQETLKAARAASPHSSESASAYFKEDAEVAMAVAIQRVWDPELPRPKSPRTPWGDPDLGGYWLNVSYTPRQRPVELADKPMYTPEEAIAVFQGALARDASIDTATVHYDWREFGMDNWQSPIRPSRRTSLIVDPANGRFPSLTPEGREQSQARERGLTLDTRGVYERCITGNQGPPRLPIGQNTGQSQIVQTPDYIVLLTQANSDVRIFSLDGSSRAPDSVRSWLGDSRGHWEEDTLVVETTNFHQSHPTPNMHLIERFTRVAEDTLLYQATVTDPTMWEAPWSIEIPWPVMEPPGLFESACHEQNYGIINVLRGVRVRAVEHGAALEE